MKPAPFEYVAPRSLGEAIDALRCSDGDAKILAGGQSLIPLLNMRLASPRRLVDLRCLAELSYVAERDGGLAIGAMTRDRAVERERRVARSVPLLADAIRWVGHPAIRNRGTVGGSIAHADPAAELPAVAVCLDGQLTIAGPRGARRAPADQFFRGYLSTALQPDEILTEVWFPSAPPDTGHAWLEFARRHGDFALVGVAVALAVSESVIRTARIALAGVGGTPVRAREAETLLIGGTVADRSGAAAQAVSSAVEPDADIHASKEYRAHLAGVLTERAVRAAFARAQAGTRPARGQALDVQRSLERMGRDA